MDQEDVYLVCPPSPWLPRRSSFDYNKEDLAESRRHYRANNSTGEPHCSAARGGIYEPEESSDWRPLGTWELGLSYLGYGGNGEYGRDRITTPSSTSSVPYSMDGVLMAAVNTTSYLNGLFGLGITQGNFNGTVAESPLTQAVKDYGWIPSYSFGYTAGAHYSMHHMPFVC